MFGFQGLLLSSWMGFQVWFISVVVGREPNRVQPPIFWGVAALWQEEGVKFMTQHLLAEGGCILADSMGLGKTLQAEDFKTELDRLNWLVDVLSRDPPNLRTGVPPFSPSARSISGDAGHVGGFH